MNKVFTEEEFRRICVSVNAKFAWADGKKYILPTEKWKEETKEDYYGRKMV